MGEVAQWKISFDKVLFDKLW